MSEYIWIIWIALGLISTIIFKKVRKIKYDPNWVIASLVAGAFTYPIMFFYIPKRSKVIYNVTDLNGEYVDTCPFCKKPPYYYNEMGLFEKNTTYYIGCNHNECWVNPKVSTIISEKCVAHYWSCREEIK